MKTKLKSCDKAMLILYVILNLFVSLTLFKFSESVTFSAQTLTFIIFWFLSVFFFFNARHNPGFEHNILDYETDELHVTSSKYCNICEINQVMI